MSADAEPDGTGAQRRARQGAARPARRREAKLLTQHELAADLRVNPSTISQLEAGNRNAHLRTIRVLASTLSVSAQELLASATPMRRPRADEAPRRRAGRRDKEPARNRSRQTRGVCSERGTRRFEPGTGTTRPNATVPKKKDDHPGPPPQSDRLPFLTKRSVAASAASVKRLRCLFRRPARSL